MGRFRGFEPAGVIPATLLAFHEDFSIDEEETRRHLSYVAGTRGISAITINAHGAGRVCPVASVAEVPNSCTGHGQEHQGHRAKEWVTKP